MADMSSPKTSVAGITGTSASIATLLALALSPNALIVAACGPMNTIPFFSQASTKSGFSESKPYPG